MSTTNLDAENRNLAKPPEWSWNAEIIRSFPGRFERYFDDHFGFRTWLIRTAKQAEWVYDRSEAGIAIGRDDWLYQGKEADLVNSHCVQLRDEELRSWQDLGRSRRDWFERRGIAFIWSMAPNKHTLYPEYFPETAATPRNPLCRGDLLSERLGREAGVDFIDLRPVLLEAKAAHRVYHRTDTHWNQLGAFFGARAILKRVRARFPEVSEPSLEGFEVRRVVDEYGGNLSGLLSIYGLRFPEERYALAPRRRLRRATHRRDASHRSELGRPSKEAAGDGDGKVRASHGRDGPRLLRLRADADHRRALREDRLSPLLRQPRLLGHRRREAGSGDRPFRGGETPAPSTQGPSSRAPDDFDRTMSDTPIYPAISRGELARHTTAVLNRGNSRNPDVLLVEVGGRQLVVKDFAPRAVWVRTTIGRWITAREVRALRALDGPAVGAAFSRLRSTHWRSRSSTGPVDACRESWPGELPPEFLGRLETALREMHRRGVAHLDLRHRSNVLVGEDGEPDPDRLRFGADLPPGEPASLAGCSLCSAGSISACGREVA